MGVDVKKLIAVVAPSLPTSAYSAGDLFLTFWLAAKSKDLKGMDIAKRFIASTQVLSVELQGCYSRIDFVF